VLLERAEVAREVARGDDRPGILGGGAGAGVEAAADDLRMVGLKSQMPTRSMPRIWAEPSHSRRKLSSESVGDRFARVEERALEAGELVAVLAQGVARAAALRGVATARIRRYGSKAPRRSRSWAPRWAARDGEHSSAEKA
jgi:hypothetical protein